jgi:integrase/recombinase XerD
MQTHNADNERIKRRYLTYLRDAKRYSESSLDGVNKALHRFDSYGKFRDFRKFHIEQAVAFKRHLEGQTNERTGKPLSKATLHATMGALRGFFVWLAGQHGYRRRLSYSDAEYFNLSEKDVRIAKAVREQPIGTVDQVRHVISSMPTGNDVERRDRALVAFFLLTGARDGAVVSLKLKHIDLVEGRLIQDAREVRTKFSKTFVTYFFPVGEEVRAIVTSWIEHLRIGLFWGPDDPLFPATRVTVGSERQFVADGLARKHWTTATSIRRIFRDAFDRVGLPYFPPHTIRKTLVQLGQRTCRTPEEFKAWSQNLGHEQVLTTFASYGSVASTRQADIIRGLASPSGEDANLLNLMEQAMRVVQRQTGTRL